MNNRKQKRGMKELVRNLSLAILGGCVAIGAYKLIEEKPKAYILEQAPKDGQPVQFASYKSAVPTGSVDFTAAAGRSVNTVVHIKTELESPSYYRDPFFDYFFGPQGNAPHQEASGSGVIIRDNGYIVTNNHVIDNAIKISVTLNNKKTYDAQLVGKDPSTDLAVLKIDAKDLPYIELGNSDEVKIGEWVLAVGNPFNLTSTVTAGIVSAKGRNINILKGNSDKNIFPIESFIQTDAAVNPGNSGGALVNANGELIGINTAIASNTGSYAGYSFAVPVNIVNKVSKDIIETGVVQRAFLGINIRDIDQHLADELKLKDNNGVYVSGIVDGGSASGSGLKTGDIILSVGSVDVNNAPELQEQVGKYGPGEVVDLRVKRNDDQLIIPVTLKNLDGNTKKVTKEKSAIRNSLGATFQEIPKQELSKLDLDNGIRVTSLSNGKLAKVGIKKGFILMKVDDTPIKSVDQLFDVVENKSGDVLLEGVYPNGVRAYYSFGL